MLRIPSGRRTRRNRVVRRKQYCLIFALVSIIFRSATAQSNTTTSSAPVLLSRSVIFNYPETDPYDPTNRYGYNHAPSIVTLANGDLLCAWFSGPYEAAVNQVILASRSRDHGLTWEKAYVLNRTVHQSDFDPAFIADADRTWIFFTNGRWDKYPLLKHELEGAVGIASYHTNCMLTFDSGLTWTDPFQFPDTFFCRSNGIRLSSGELLLPVYKVRPTGKDGEAYAFRSIDGGKHWAMGNGIWSSAGADEPSIAEVSGGRVIMILRTVDGLLWRCYSSDKGQTWSQPIKSDIPAAWSSHNIFRLRDGRLALTHSPCPAKFRTPLTIRISDDDGQTWGHPLLLAQVSPPPLAREHQVTYPSVTQLSDDTLVVVWAEIVLNDNQQYGNIWSARVSVPPIGRS